MKYLVAGNYTRFAVTLTQKSGELITPYIPTEGDVVQIILYGARRFDYPNYTQSSNVLTFEDNGCLQVGIYFLEVKITEANTHKLRCMYREQIRVVASNDDVPTDASFSDDDIQLNGQFDIVASTEIVVDDELSLTSTNPVQNRVVTAAINGKADAIDVYEDAEDGVYVYRVDLISNFGEDTTTISSAILPYATQDDGGLMSANDKTKLDGIETGANKTLFDNAPTQSSTNAVTSGGVYSALAGKADALAGEITAAGYEIDLKSGNTALSQVYVPFATAQDDGLMSANDYSKLQGIEAGANKTLFDNTPTEGSTKAVTSGGIEYALKHNVVNGVGFLIYDSGTKLKLIATDAYGTILDEISEFPTATTSTLGLMSADDKTKLDGIATGATKVIVDSAFDITSNNAISNSAVATALKSKEDKVAVEAPVNTTDDTLPITALSTDTGKYYRIDVAVETLAITLPAMTDNTKIANVVLYLTGGTSPAVTIASTAPSGGTAPDVYFQDGFAIEAGKTYEINCLWNGLAWVIAAVEIVIS